jgi:predicted deacetylase
MATAVNLHKEVARVELGADKSNRSVAIVLHDVAPATWPECQVLLQMIAELSPGCRVTLLVVPNYHHRGSIDATDPQWRAAIDHRIAAGDEVALHGYWHVDDSASSRTPVEWFARRVLTASEGEFSALDAREARMRIERGLRLFDKLGWRASGFVAPAWQMSAGCRTVLAEFPLRYTSDLRAMYSLPDWQRHAALSMSFSSRSAWRRVISPRWNRFALDATRHAPLVRIALHPADARYPQLLAAWRSLLSDTLRDRTPVTKVQWLQEQQSPALSSAA